MASNMTNSSIDWLKIVRLNSFRVFLSVFINSRLLDEVAGGAGVTTSTPCGGTVFKYFGSKFGRRKSKSFVNSLLAPSRLFPFPPIPQRPAKGEPWRRLSILSRCSRNPFAAAATPPGPARVRAKGFFRPFALWPEFWWGFPCWTGFGRGLRAALAFRRQKKWLLRQNLRKLCKPSRHAATTPCLHRLLVCAERVRLRVYFMSYLLMK